MNEVITNLILAVIAVAASFATVIVIPSIKEWLAAKTTSEQQAVISALAKTAVYAAQQLFTANEDKLDYAINHVKEAAAEKGITPGWDEIREAIEAALKEIKVSISENGGEW